MQNKTENRGGARLGSGRKATGIKRVSLCISGQPEQVERLKKLAEEAGQNVSEFIFNKTGVNMRETKTNWTIILNSDFGKKEICGWEDDLTLIDRVRTALEAIEGDKVGCLIYWMEYTRNSLGAYVGSGNPINELSAIQKDKSNWIGKKEIIEFLKKKLK